MQDEMLTNTKMLTNNETLMNDQTLMNDKPLTNNETLTNDEIPPSNISHLASIGPASKMQKYLEPIDFPAKIRG